MKQEINRHEILEKITPLIENTAMRFDLIPIEIDFSKENHRWFLRIFLYSHKRGITLDDCENVTRSLNDFLDELIPVKYYLEVSSPGIDRPLKKENDFRANYGKKVDVQLFAPLEGNKELTGVLLSHTETAIEVKRIVKSREENKPIKIERKLIAVIRPHIDF